MDVKSFFHAWCTKNSKSFNFDVRPVGMKHKQRFLCELSVDGHPYKGWGNSTNKKDSQFNAARDFLQYLIRQNLVNPKEVPPETFGRPHGGKEDAARDEADSASQSRPVFEPGMTPQSMGEAYRPYRQGEDNSTYTYIDRLAEARKNGEEVVVDMNAAIHGNWTLENGKSRLHQFLQQHNIKADYTYSVSGAQHNRCFVAEMSIWVKSLNRTLTGRESASNKSAASKSCALSLVRQLYHLGVIEGFSTTTKKKNKVAEVDPYPVSVDPALEEEIYDVLKELNIKPTEIPKEELPEDQAVSIINSSVLEEFLASKPQPAGVISWSPPINNWNPWTACNIDEGPLASATLDEISQDLEKSRRRQLLQDKNLQKSIKDREELPVAAVRSTIMQSISDNSVIIVRGNTGCGKTTQICQFILDDHIYAGQGAYCNIIVTQPRRISAVSVADRVAFERSEPLGQSVGYTVRFESCYPRPFGSIMFCTVGVLLRKLENGLKGVSHVIVDEIHERDVNTDFIMVVLRDMVHTYPDLRVILMSATIDTTLFSKYFGNCPVVEIPGRSFPVQTFFLEDCIEMIKFEPSTDGKKKKRKHDDEEDETTHAMDELEENLNKVISDQYPREVKAAMAQLSERELCFELFEELLKYIKGLNIPGAVLIFLPGWNYIFVLMRHLLSNSFFRTPDFVILPLHSQLPREEQRRVFDSYPPKVTKVILATNIAETSITINDVVFVIDSCKVKVKTFTTHNNITQYNTVWASKSNLEQRKGRAGRVQPGMCFFLVSKARYEKLEEHITPEMLRTPLHELGLTIKVLRLGAIGQFLSKAIEPPPIDTVVEAEVLLREMKCLDSNDELTPLGRILGRMPVDPRLGKMLILGCIFHCGDALATITASSSTMPEVFLQYPDRKRLTFQQKAFSGNRCSDHIAILHVFQSWLLAVEEGENSEDMFCESKMVSRPGLRIISEAKNQLIDILTGVTGFPEETVTPLHFNYFGTDDNLDLVTGLLCMGLYPNIAYHVLRRKVITAGSRCALISKTSVNCTNQDFTPPIPFFVFGEKIRTKAISCKQLTMITPIHLLLFGTRSVEYVNKKIKLDGWLSLNMKPELASAIVALRPAIEGLIIKATKDPSQVSENSPSDTRVIHVVTELCKLNAGRHNLKPIIVSDDKLRQHTKHRTLLGRYSPPPKLPYLPNNRNRGYGYGQGYASGYNNNGGYRSGYNNSGSYGSGYNNNGERGGWFGGYGDNRGSGSMGSGMNIGMNRGMSGSFDIGTNGGFNRGLDRGTSGGFDGGLGQNMSGSLDRGLGQSTSGSFDRGLGQSTSGSFDRGLDRDASGSFDRDLSQNTSGSFDRSLDRDTSGSLDRGLGQSTSGSFDRGLDRDTSGSFDRGLGQSMSGSFDRGLGQNTSGSFDRGLGQSTSGSFDRGLGQSTSGSFDRGLDRDASGSFDRDLSQNTSGSFDRGLGQSTSGSFDRGLGQSTSGSFDRGLGQDTSGSFDRNLDRDTSGDLDRSRERSTSGSLDGGKDKDTSGSSDRSREKSRTGSFDRGRDRSRSGSHDRGRNRNTDRDRYTGRDWGRDTGGDKYSKGPSSSRSFWR